MTIEQDFETVREALVEFHDRTGMPEAALSRIEDEFNPNSEGTLMFYTENLAHSLRAEEKIRAKAEHQRDALKAATRDLEARLHYVSESNLCPLCQCRIGKHLPDCRIGQLRQALKEVEA